MSRERTIKEELDHYCVYRLLDEEGNILYIGKSSQMKQRIMNHLRGRSNIPNECCSNIKRVEYLEFKTEVDMDIFELYAISYFQPPYNKEGVSKTGIIKIRIPKVWNELLLDTFDKIVRTEVIGGATDLSQYNLDEVDMKGLRFNRQIFIDPKLTDFIETHYEKHLSSSDIEELVDICNMEEFDIDNINNYIAYNDSKAEVIIDDDEYYLKRNVRSKYGFGSIKEKNMSGKNYLCFRVRNNKEEKCFYGKNRIEVASKVLRHFLNKQVELDLYKEDDCGTEEVGELLNKIKTTKKYTGGINKTLQKYKLNEGYNQDNNKLPELLTMHEAMEYLKIKDTRRFHNLNIPHIKIGKKILIPLETMNQWINKNMSI